jgi:DNA-3-methyladenine glycosylase
MTALAPAVPAHDPINGIIVKPAARPLLGLELFEGNAIDVARELVGAVVLINGVGGMIVETEAYLREDAASHSFRGQTRRNGSMFSGAGRAYVYRSHGLHWCLNAVCGPEPGCAVLIRAIQPLVGKDLMHSRRRVADVRLLCSGPGRLCQALSIDGSYDGLALDAPPFEFRRAEVPTDAPVCTTRIGISKAIEQPWRFCLAGSPFVSRPSHNRTIGTGRTAVA